MSGSKKTNIFSSTVVIRQTDAEYIQYLEERLRIIDKRVENFIQGMDKIMFSDSADKEFKLMEFYVDSLGMLKFDD